MTHTNTVVETRINRKLIVNHYSSSVDLDVNDTSKFPDDGKRVYSLLTHGEAEKLGLALLGENATVITDLPEAKLSTCGRYVMVGDIDRSLHASAPDILAHAKQLLAIAAFLTKHNAEQEEAKKAEAEAEAAKAKEAANAKRRDEVTQELTGDPYARYSDRFAIVKKAIDRIVDLEEAAKVS